jgi:pimeloyl-ACP methyl ester carboxylesterase
MLKLNSGLFRALLFFLTIQVTAQSQEVIPADIDIDRDGIVLKGKFYQAAGEGACPTVILLQGSPGNTTDVIGLGKRLPQYGINAMTFNYSGTHQSGGRLSFPNSLGDISAAFKFLDNPENIRRFKIDTASVILAGYSYGGGMAMTYAIKHKEIAAVISIAGNDWGEFYEEYLRKPEMKSSIDAGIDKSVAAGILRFEPGSMPKEMGEALTKKLDQDFFTTRKAPLLADRDILLICGWDDPMVTVEGYILPIYRALRNENARNVRIVGFQDDHTFSKSRDEVARAIADWIKAAPERKK